MTDDVQHATFLAAFPAIQSAIKCGQDTWRIQLDIPASELQEAKKLLDWQGVALMITVVPINKGLTELDDEASQEPKRGGATLDRRRAAIRRD